MIQKWINNGCDYEEGVRLYAQVGKNMILLKRFHKNWSAWNEEKLKNELLKFNSSKSIPKKSPQEAPMQPTTSPTRTAESPVIKEIKSKPISAYPAKLHPVYQLRVNSFYKYASLKMQLNKLAPEKESEALKIQFEIWEEIMTNDKCWKILQHYDETGIILPLDPSSDFSNLSPQELVNQRQRLYVNKSKRMKTISNLSALLSKEKNEAKKIHTTEKLRKKQGEIQQIENDIQELTTLINGK